MCTETFLRLPEEKRNRFLNAAWEEFTTVRFVDASVNQIVRRASIPRGSFYQYFTGKDDLFAYLLEDVRGHVQAEYRQVLQGNGGDIFQAQLDCFDRLVSGELSGDPTMERCMALLRLNQGMDLQKLLPTCPGRRLLDGLWDVMDLSILRRQDQEYGKTVFSLLMAALGSAFMGTLLRPEEKNLYREELAEKLEIVRHGSVNFS